MNTACEVAAPATILVVEPDILVRITIAEHLRNCGYRVLEAATAEDVMSVLGSGRTVEIVLMEVALPGSIDGFALAQWLRRRHPAIDTILASGVAGAAERVRDLCEDGPLAKPYQPQEVMRRINLLLERRRSAVRGPKP
jgi:DNA-binding response OmpR family regulator